MISIGFLIVIVVVVFVLGVIGAFLWIRAASRANG